MTNQPVQGGVCSHRHAFFLDNIIRGWLQNPRRIVGEYVSKGDVVIDMGCGPGFFSVAMAGMVGREGRVFCVDLQPEMLDKTMAKARRKNVSDQVRVHRCLEDRIGLDESVGADFILAYYMVHELPDQAAFFDEVRSLLKPDGRFLVVEPKFHVSRGAFDLTCRTAQTHGFVVSGSPSGKGGHSLLLTLPKSSEL